MPADSHAWNAWEALWAVALVVAAGRVLESPASRVPSIFLSPTADSQRWAVLSRGDGREALCNPLLLRVGRGGAGDDLWGLTGLWIYLIRMGQLGHGWIQSRAKSCSHLHDGTQHCSVLGQGVNASHHVPEEALVSLDNLTPLTFYKMCAKNQSLITIICQFLQGKNIL